MQLREDISRRNIASDYWCQASIRLKDQWMNQLSAYDRPQRDIAHRLLCYDQMQENPTYNLTTAILGRLGLLALYPLMWLNVKHPAIAFSYSPLNYVAFILVMLIPFMLFIFCRRLPHGSMKVIGAMVLLPLMIQAGLWGGLAVVALPIVFGTGQLFVSEGKTIETPFWTLKYYRGDGYIIVTQEKSIVPGLLLVKEIYHTGGPDPIIDVVDSDTIRLVSQPGIPQQQTTEHRLSRFVYF